MMDAFDTKHNRSFSPNLYKTKKLSSPEQTPDSAKPTSPLRKKRVKDYSNSNDISVIQIELEPTPEELKTIKDFETIHN